VAVSCDEQDNQMETQAMRSPRLVVEVLSPSTEAEDRGYKFFYYRALPSLQEYVLVSSRFQFVEVYRRQQPEIWSYQAYRPEQLVKLESLDIALTFADIYRRVTVPARPELLQ
jgi:Uma2 family endonuclease